MGLLRGGVPENVYLIKPKPKKSPGQPVEPARNYLFGCTYVGVMSLSRFGERSEGV
jgi:hypothetical protein